MEFIDIIYYINLDHRFDRNTQFLGEMNKMDISLDKVQRISAIYHIKGAIGCSSSHILALKIFLQSPYNICIIFEDDFEFIISKDEFNKQLHSIFRLHIDFDVLLLGSNVITADFTPYNFLKKAKNAQTTSGYIVTKEYAIKYLLDNFIIGKHLLISTYDEPKYAIDQYWKNLQPCHNWYILWPKVGKQRESYSDILNGRVNYGV